MNRSLLTDDWEHCYLCHRYIGNGGGECHHVFSGANRKNSDEYGLVVPLCHWCHNEPPNGVHHNFIVRHALQEKAQRAFEEKYDREEFIEIFGRNFI